QKMRKKLPSGAELQDLWVEGDFDKDGKTELVIFSLSPEDIAVSSVSDVVRFYKKTPNGVEQVYSEKLYDAYISTGFVHSMIPQIIDIDNGGLYELVVKGGSHGYYYTRIYNMDRNGVNVAKIESEETQFIDMNRDGSKEIISNENNSTAVYSWNGSRLVRNHNLEGKVQTASRELQSIASNSSYSTADKRSRMYDVQHTYGEALTLVAVRMFPVQDPADGKWKPFDSYMRGFVDKNSDGAFAGTPMGKDPVGVAFDLMIGKYNPNEFVADHFGDICSSGSRRYGSSGIEVVERYPGRPGQEWSKVRTPAGDNLYRDPQGGLHYSMGGDAINTSPQVISRGYSQGKEWIEYRNPITGDKWMESRPEPKPENDWRTVKTEQIMLSAGRNNGDDNYTF
ncbi:MAG: hypothetical protein HZB67_00535, partial [Candidatus Aenigmarchaeota archaeon]|nr:hypothetical protein [Candidatus Aenigmarchaeota archaeon]